jgi:hypothetical protein
VDRIDHHLPRNRIDCGFPDRDSKAWLRYNSNAFAGLKYNATAVMPGYPGKDPGPMCLIRIVTGILDDIGSYRPILLDNDSIDRDHETMDTARKKNVDLRRVPVTQHFQQSSFHGSSCTCAGCKASFQPVLSTLREIKERCGIRAELMFVVRHLQGRSFSK